MQLSIIAVGRARQGPITTLFADYKKRLPWPLTLHEVHVGGRLAPAERREREAALIVARVPANGYAIALDETGEALSSQGLADHLSRLRAGGTRSVAFLIGGAEGHGASALARADLALSLGRMTWPHLLVRVMLVEQLWRAASVMAGHPYHRA